MILPENILTPIGNLRGDLTSGGLIPGLPEIIGNANINPVYFPDGTNNPIYKMIANIGASGYTQAHLNIYGYNLLPDFSHDDYQNGVDLKVNEDGSVTLNGTATATIVFRSELSNYYKWDGNQDLWISGCPSGGDFSSKYALRIDGYNQGWTQWSEPDSGNGRKLINPVGRDLTNIPIAFGIVIRNGYTCNNITFKPMLNIGLSPLDYRKFKEPKIYNINWEDIAGTISNGTIIIENGMIKVSNGVNTYNIRTNDLILQDRDNSIWIDCGSITELKYIISMQYFLQWIYDNLYNP